MMSSFTATFKKTQEEKIPALHRSLKRASTRFSVQNMFKKSKEFEEYHPLVQELGNADREYFFQVR